MMPRRLKSTLRSGKADPKLGHAVGISDDLAMQAPTEAATHEAGIKQQQQQQQDGAAMEDTPEEEEDSAEVLQVGV